MKLSLHYQVVKAKTLPQTTWLPTEATVTTKWPPCWAGAKQLSRLEGLRGLTGTGSVHHGHQPGEAWGDAHRAGVTQTRGQVLSPREGLGDPAASRGWGQEAGGHLRKLG